MFLGSAFGAVLSGYCMRRRTEPGAAYLGGLLFCASWWSLFYGLELLTPDVGLRQAWYGIGILGNAPIAALSLLFALDYSGSRLARQRWFIALLAVEPLVHVAMNLTNDLHGLVWSDLRQMPFGSLTLSVRNWGIWFVVDETLGFLQVGVALLALVRYMMTAPALFKGQLVGILGGIGLTALFRAFLHLAGEPAGGFDFTHVSFVVGGSALALSFFRFGLFDVLPAAREVVVEAMLDGIIVLDKNDHCVDANRAGTLLLNGPLAKVVGRSSREALLDAPYGALARARATGGPVEVSLDDKRSYEARISPVVAAAGQAVGEVVVFRDISGEVLVREAQREATRMAEDNARARGEFLANVSHELRTPLHMILGFADALSDEGAEGLTDSQKEFVEEIANAGGLLLVLINLVVELTKIDTGKRPVEEAEFDLVELCQQVAVRLEHKLGYDIEVLCDKPPVLVYTDLSILFEVIERLSASALALAGERCRMVYRVLSIPVAGCDRSLPGQSLPGALFSLELPGATCDVSSLSGLLESARTGSELPAGTDLRSWLESRVASRLAMLIGATLHAAPATAGAAPALQLHLPARPQHSDHPEDA